VYQASRGGKTVVPLEAKGRFLGSSNTPKFSKIVSWKYSHMSARLVREDLQMNHSRLLSTKLVQSVSAHVEEGAEAICPHNSCFYEVVDHDIPTECEQYSS